MSDQPDDLEKTTKMDEPPAKKAKQKGDWITMPMQSATKGTDVPASAAESSEKKASPNITSAPPNAPVTASAPPSAPATAQAPASASTEGMPASSGGIGSFLSSFGITDPNTQKIVLFGGGGFILLCCLCTCIGVGLSTMGILGQ